MKNSRSIIQTNDRMESLPNRRVSKTIQASKEAPLGNQRPKISSNLLSSPELFLSEKIEEIEYLKRQSTANQISNLAKLGYQMIGRQSASVIETVGERYLQPSFSKRKQNSIRNRTVLEQIHFEQNKSDKARLYFQRRIKENKIPRHRASKVTIRRRIKQSESQSKLLKQLKKEQVQNESESYKNEFLNRRFEEIRLEEEKEEQKKQLQRILNEKRFKQRRNQAEYYWTAKAERLERWASQSHEVKHDDGLINLAETSSRHYEILQEQVRISNENGSSQIDLPNNDHENIQSNLTISSNYHKTSAIFNGKHSDDEQNTYSNDTPLTSKSDNYPTISVFNTNLRIDSEIER